MEEAKHRRPWSRRWLLRGARFGLLIGLIAGGKQAWSDLSVYDAEIRRTVSSQLGYECAARLDDGILRQNQNEFGNVNIKKFGCSSDDFYVSLKEITDVRSGAMKFVTDLKPVYPLNVLVASILGVLATLLLTSLAVLLLKMLKWAWGTRA